MRKMNNLFSRVYKKEESCKSLVLGISASPRVGGNSEIILDKTLAGAKDRGFETKKIRINEYDFKGCQSCENVRDDGFCSINDDFQKIYQQIKQAQIIVLSSPIFFGNISAQAKAMIDRFQCHWRAACLLKKLKNVPKKGYFLCVQADREKEYFTNAEQIVKNFFSTVGIKYCGQIFCDSVDAPGSINDYPEKLQQAYELAQGFLE